MATETDLNRYAPPVAHVDDVTPEGARQLAGRGARLGAVVIDGLIQAGAYWALALTAFSSLIPTGDRFNGNGWVGTLLLQLAVSLVLFVVLQGYLLATQGQTIGKKLLGLRIVRSNGERASFGRLLGLRTVLGWALVMIPFVGAIYGLIDALLIFRASHQCLHDNIADTIVVKA